MRIMSAACNIKKCRNIIALLLLCVVISNAFGESLYNEESYRGLAVDAKASHIGDSLTVLIVETSTAETGSDTAMNESSDNSLSLNTSSPSLDSLALNTGSNYKSGGESIRNGKLLAKITVTVHEILPTGELRVKGEQNIKINNEEQTIILSGNIRPIDIGADNTVLSTRIANAKIKYQGEGYISDDTPGLITQFFRWIF